MNTCPVCGESCQTTPHHPDPREYSCVRCGRYALFGTINANLPGNLNWHQRSVLSHKLRSRQLPAGVATLKNGGDPILAEADLPLWRLDDPLPNPAERLDRLVTLVGKDQPSPAQSAPIHPSAASAWIGEEITAQSPGAALGWLLEQPETRALLAQRGGPAAQSLSLRLTMAGWQRYEALKRAEVTSRTAFMAMQFGDAELNRVVETCFRPAAQRAGFNLRVLTDGQPAGLIDDQMRVALRTSRFTIADLTHDNRGAYWEAGFAEGLGRPVIYTCRKDNWEDQKPHFDTNHLVTIQWDPANLDQAGRNLTATIRATLLSEAKLTDEL